MMISSLIPKNLKDFLIKIEELGVSLCLVGGAPRDFLLTQTLSHDLDFEIRNAEMSVLRNYFSANNVKYDELPYEILRVDFQDFDLEFSLPRLEKPLTNNKTHHHFDAILDKNLSYSEGLKRRDFTINAMGVVLDLKNQTETFVDPYNGKDDLDRKILKEISDDFFLDSVRFLRLVRFAIKYDFSIDPNLENRLERFDLSELSKHHFISEMMKSKKPGAFITRFNLLVKKHSLDLGVEFRFFGSINFSNEETIDDLLFTSFKQKRAKEFQAFFSLPEKKLKDLESFNTSFEIIKKLSLSELKKITAKPLSDSSDLETLKHLKNLEDKKDLKTYYDEKLPLSWNDWEKVRVSQSELEALSPKLRSYLKYYKAILDA